MAVSISVSFLSESLIMLDNINLNISQKIVLLTATADLTEESVESLKQLLKSNPDWPYIKNFTQTQGTAPLLFKVLKKNNLSHLVPEVYYNYLQSLYYQTHSQNILALEQLKKVLAAFNKAGIKTILLKGIASAEFIYKDLGLRPMGDIDIMVEPDNILAGEKILFELGYINEMPYKSYKLRTLNIYNHLNTFHYKNIKLELHRELNSSHHIYRIPSEFVWKNIKQVNIEGETAYTLNTEANIQYLSIHSVVHFLNKKIRLNSFADIAELLKIEKNNINWKTLENDCKTHKNTLAVERALSISRTYLSAPVPDNLFKSFNASEGSLDNEFVLLLNNQTEKIHSKAPSDYFKKIKNIDGYRNRLNYLLAEAFPSKAFIVYTYRLKNKNLFFLYYFVQFYRQTRKFFKNIFFLKKA